MVDELIDLRTEKQGELLEKGSSINLMPRIRAGCSIFLCARQVVIIIIDRKYALSKLISASITWQGN